MSLTQLWQRINQNQNNQQNQAQIIPLPNQNQNQNNTAQQQGDIYAVIVYVLDNCTWRFPHLGGHPWFSDPRRYLVEGDEIIFDAHRMKRGKPNRNMHKLMVFLEKQGDQLVAHVLIHRSYRYTEEFVGGVKVLKDRLPEILGKIFGSIGARWYIAEEKFHIG